MHRTQGDGFTYEGGLRRFISQSLPGEEGSTISGEFGNALQEEIINLIEAAGLSPNASEAADRTDGWDQMKTALFDSEALGTTALADAAVTTDKIADCDLSKLSYVSASGGTDITYVSGSETFELSIDMTQIIYQYANATSGISEAVVFGRDSTYFTRTDSGTQTHLWTIEPDQAKTYGYQYLSATNRIGHTEDPVEGFSHTQISASAVATEAKLSYNGLTFTELGQESFKTAKMTVVDLDNGVWTGSGPYTLTESTLLPTTVQPLTLEFRYRVVATGEVFVAKSTTSSGYDYRFVDVGGFWVMNIYTPVSLASASYDQRWAMLWYAR